MEYVVCIKQVPDTTEVQWETESKTLAREGITHTVNPFDKNAVEAALRLREKYGGRVTLISMGPPQAKEALRECLAMGADEALLLSDKTFAGADTWATSYTLAQAVNKLERYHIILCGKQAVDGETAQVGPGLAEHLGIPQVTCIQKINKLENSRLEVERTIEGGAERVAVSLPVLLTVEKSLNDPRYATLKGVMKANQKEIPLYDAGDLEVDPSLVGLKGSPTQVKKIFSPEKRVTGEIITGEPGEAAQKLAQNILELKLF